jgi:hypothetical protein
MSAFDPPRKRSALWDQRDCEQRQDKEQRWAL